MRNLVDLLREAESAISVLDENSQYEDLANRICAALARFPDEPTRERVHPQGDRDRD